MVFGVDWVELPGRPPAVLGVPAASPLSISWARRVSVSHEMFQSKNAMTTDVSLRQPNGLYETVEL